MTMLQVREEAGHLTTADLPHLDKFTPKCWDCKQTDASIQAMLFWFLLNLATFSITIASVLINDGWFLRDRSLFVVQQAIQTNTTLPEGVASAEHTVHQTIYYIRIRMCRLADCILLTEAVSAGTDHRPFWCLLSDAPFGLIAAYIITTRSDLSTEESDLLRQPMRRRSRHFSTVVLPPGPHMWGVGVYGAQSRKGGHGGELQSCLSK